jgi:hypothetical protein
MTKTFALAFALLAVTTCSSALAQENQFESASTGSAGNVTSTTGEAPGNLAPNKGISTGQQNTMTQFAPTAQGYNPAGQLLAPIAKATSKQNTLAGRYGGLYTRNGLPFTSMDSFVQNSIMNGTASYIYGDEGSGYPNDGYGGLPPLRNFLPVDRINSGITGINGLGLTTGHSSLLPSATGADEFVGPSLGYPIGEWSESGSKSTFLPTINMLEGGGIGLSMPGVPAGITLGGGGTGGLTSGGLSTGSGF